MAGNVMEHSLERDMKDAPWFVAKVRASESYAQNVYAALCNNDFQKLEVVSVLKDQVWGCSWRYAGGLVANLRCEGDYMDWYCSGIRNTGLYGEDDLTASVSEEQLAYMATTSKFVAESVVTEEVREDLKQLGWVVVEDCYDDGI
jgi:hypothetical protein